MALFSRQDFFGKIESFFFYALIVAFPFQVRKVIYSTGWAFNEWQSVSVYLTDLILALLFIFWLIRILRKESKVVLLRHDFWLVGFFGAAGLSIINSSNVLVSSFAWLKLAEFILLYFYLKNYGFSKFGTVQIVLAFMVGGFFQAIIAIAQFAVQGHVGFHWLGEGILGPNIPGVAVFINSTGERIMRAYGTTPHANILAGYLLVCLSVLIAAWHYFASLKDKRPYYLLMAAYAVIFFGFFLAFSRTALFAFGIGLLVFTFYNYRTSRDTWRDIKKLFIFSIILGVIFSIIFWPELSSRILISGSEEAVAMRIYFAKESVDSGFNFFGVGIGNFVGWLMEKDPNQPGWVYQPAHSLYLLVYTETGLLGSIFFTLFLIYVFKGFKKNLPLSVLILAGSILFIALFDHFLWTLQQGRFIWWGVLALISSFSLTKDSRRGKM